MTLWCPISKRMAVVQIVLAEGVDADEALDKHKVGVKYGVKVKAGVTMKVWETCRPVEMRRVRDGFKDANRFDVLLDEDEGQLDTEGQGQGSDSWEREIKILSWNVDDLNSEKNCN